MTDENKAFYRQHADTIWEKRFNSSDPIRRHAHRAQYGALLDAIGVDGSVLDAGCGEGVIPILLAERGIASTGVDISEPNVAAAQAEAARRGVSHLATFLTGDVEDLPFPDKSFDTVVSSHVLEHLPDFDKGFRELCRVARRRVVVALPTCLNLAGVALLGGDHGYWKFSKRSFIALPWGILRIIGNVFGEGVQEGYAGREDLPHVWRYPWVMRRKLRHPDFVMSSFCASTFVFPYFAWTLPFVRWLERYRSKPILRNFGYGSIAIFERRGADSLAKSHNVQ